MRRHHRRCRIETPIAPILLNRSFFAVGLRSIGTDETVFEARAVASLGEVLGTTRRAKSGQRGSPAPPQSPAHRAFLDSLKLRWKRPAGAAGYARLGQA